LHSLRSITRGYLYLTPSGYKLITDYAAHREVLFQLAFADAPFSDEPLRSPGCIRFAQLPGVIYILPLQGMDSDKIEFCQIYLAFCSFYNSVILFLSPFEVLAFGA